MRRAVAVTALALVAGVGCGGGGNGLSPREQGMRNTFEGSYQVKGEEDGRVQGVGIYDNGSFRIVVEGTPYMVIYNQESGEGWQVNLQQKDYEPISHGEALLKAGFMPYLVMKPYFDLEQFWEGAEFHMDTADGRSIRAYLEGPGYLPSAWEVEAQGRVFERLSWEYRRVGRVSRENFQLPGGLKPRG